MTAKEFEQEIATLWQDMRRDGEMVVDFPSLKVGMPWAVPYEGVCFPLEIDGSTEIVSIPKSEIARFAKALLNLVPVAQKLDSEADIQIAAHDAITKAKGW